MFRRICIGFGPKMENLLVACINQHNEEPHNLNATLNIIMISKSRRVGWRWGILYAWERGKAH
jgi:hypothetical protein